MLQKRTSQLVAALKSRTNQPIDLAEWLAFMALDYMGDFAWGGYFEFMRDGDPDGFRALAEKFVNVIETLGTIPWLKPIIVALPRQTGKLLETSFRVAKERQETGSSNGQKDLFYYLVSVLLQRCLFSPELCPPAGRRRKLWTSTYDNQPIGDGGYSCCEVKTRPLCLSL